MVILRSFGDYGNTSWNFCTRQRYGLEQKQNLQTEECLRKNLQAELKGKLNSNSACRSTRVCIQSNGSMARRVPDIDTQISSSARNERYIVKRIKARKKALLAVERLEGWCGKVWCRNEGRSCRMIVGRGIWLVGLNNAWCVRSRGEGTVRKIMLQTIK